MARILLSIEGQAVGVVQKALAIDDRDASRLFEAFAAIFEFERGLPIVPGNGDGELVTRTRTAQEIVECLLDDVLLRMLSRVRAYEAEQAAAGVTPIAATPA